MMTGTKMHKANAKSQKSGSSKNSLSRWERAGVRAQATPSLDSRYPTSSPQPLASSPSAAKAAAARHGVLILVVLSLLVMFALMAMTYVLLASKQYQQSKKLGRSEANQSSPHQQVEAAFLQLVRDTNNEHSALHGQGILPDLYGEPTQYWDTGSSQLLRGPNSIEGKIGTTGVTSLVGNQILDFDTAFSTDTIVSPLESYYEGCVLTMTDGPARGLSTRIVRFYYDTSVSPPMAHFRVLPFKSHSGQVQPVSGNSFIVNGRPFSGTGIGYKLGSATIDAKDRFGREYALLPNAAHYDSSGGDYDPDPAIEEDNIPFGGWGGPNEGYDGADSQNMFMSLMTDSGTVVLPSFHRPDLINFWKNRSGTPVNWADPADADGIPGRDAARLLRQICLRPNPVDHPFFNGSNPNLDLTSPNWQSNLMGVDAGGNPIRLPPWDIDNDGDGLADSVWLDLGFPVRTTLDGRKYKPLIAFHVVDLDGRVNVNAHGSSLQTDTEFAKWQTNLDLQNSRMAGSVTGNVRLPRGQGWGVADVNLRMVFQGTEEVDRLLRGSSTSEGRYGAELSNVYTGLREAGITDDSSDITNLVQTDKLANLKRFQFPPPNGNTFSAFSTEPDLWGRLAIGLDFAGQPIYWKLDNLRQVDTWRLNYIGEAFDTPYDINLSRNASRTGSLTRSSTADNPFTVYDLEQILRPWDIDTVSLSHRLRDMEQPSSGNSIAWRNKITTDSWDFPCPSFSTPRHLRSTTQIPRSIADLAAAKIKAINSGWDDPQVNSVLRQMIAPELLLGQRLNINRPLGDGRDSDGDGYVDEPDDAEVQAEGIPPATTNSSLLQVPGFGTTRFSLVNGQDVNLDGNSDWRDDLQARQLLARHLYILARLIIDDSYLPQIATATTNVNWFTEDAGDLSPEEKNKLAIRRIAQWCVNIVDFMDADNICTPFEFDYYPFHKDDTSGYAGQLWEVDGMIDPSPGATSEDVQSWRGLVWGCEAPVLLLTETLAFHDRRVKDSSFDAGGGDKVADGDTHFDQRRIPQGSAFFELYCAMNANSATQYPDLYDYDSGTGRWALHLGRMTPAVAGNPSYPVWRLAISEQTNTPQNDALTRSAKYRDQMSFDTEQLRASAASLSDTFSLLYESPPDADKHDIQIDRIVWFTNTAPTTQADANRVYYRREGSDHLYAGQYAVIGPREVTRIGWTNKPGTGTYAAPANEPSKQKIVLDPGGEIATYDHGATPTLNYPSTTDTIQPPLAMIVASDPPASWVNRAVTAPKGIGINISEPVPSETNYYPEPDRQRGAFDGEPAITDAYGDLLEADDSNGKFLDEPLDGRGGMPLENFTATGTRVNFKTVFLQRLANPLAPFHERTNPYLTVDWMPIDLTVFNGDDRVAAGGQADPQDSSPDTNPPVRFASRQRGALSSFVYPPTPADLSKNTNSNLWLQASEQPKDSDESTTDTESNFRHELKYYTTPGTPSANTLFDGQGRHTLGFLNGSYGYPLTNADLAGYSALYRGSPSKPFPWMTWNNRPFANIGELLLVPASHPGRLLIEASLASNDDPYDADTNTDPKSERAPFNHLLNFFSSSLRPDEATNISALLEYLQVPSPFVGTETVLDPTAFQNPATPGTEGLHAPFNVVSNYRDPGKVNINTVIGEFNTSTSKFESDVWNAVLGGNPALNPEIPGPIFESIAMSRRGCPPDSSSPNDPYRLNPAYPSIIANPFRSAAAADITPLIGSGIPPTDLRRKPVNSTLLRMGGVDPDNDTSLGPLLTYNTRTPYSGTQYNDPSRNPFFSQQALSRISSKLTTRSNVFAVWITVGYFEVEPHDPTVTRLPAGPNEVYPDGYWLGQELGIDTGEVTRHRGFYIFDRSIPVGYERGKDHNVMDAVLLRRLIE